MDEQFQEIEHECIYCGSSMVAYINIQTGCIDPIFCCDDCHLDYFNERRRRFLITQPIDKRIPKPKPFKLNA